MATFKSNMRDRARDAANARKNQSTGNSCLRLPDGVKVEYLSIDKDCTLRLDVIPYVVTDKHHPDRQHGAEVGSLWHSRRYFVHRDIGSDNRAFICPNKTWGKPCPICDYAKQRRKEGASKKELDSYWPKEKMLYNIIDTEADKNKMLLYDVSYHNFTKQLDRELCEGEEDWGGFAELKNGYTLKARFGMESFNKNNFAKCDRVDFVPRKYDYDERDVEDALPLDDILIEVPYNELEEIFMNGSIGDTAPDQNDDNSRQRGRGGREREERSNDQDERETARSGRGRGKNEAKENDDDGQEEKTSRSRTREKREDKNDSDQETTGRRGRASHDEKQERDSRRSRSDENKDDDQNDSAERGRGGRRNAKNDEEKETVNERAGRRGRNNDDDDDDKQDKGRRGGRADKNECPHEFKFGRDCDKYAECDDCKKWEACRDENHK